MSRGRRDVLIYLTILLVSGSTMTKLLVCSLLTKSSPVFLASPPEDNAVRNVTINPNVSSFKMRIDNLIKQWGVRRRIFSLPLVGQVRPPDHRLYTLPHPLCSHNIPDWEIKM